MPTLDWIGKKAVLNHHRQVPYHLLRSEEALSVGDPDSGNLLVQGDNLLALKALLPYYAGKVKCIYIDPPYNTGNENWVYNDAVNSPEMKHWLGKVVGAEAEDLSRHDKWLLMMHPRLSLLREFLSEDGAIFISIDDNEVHSLRKLMDEIFSPRNFIATVIWQKVYSPKNSAKHFSEDHDYIIVYAKHAEGWRPNLLSRTLKQDKAYKNPDNDPRGPRLPDRGKPLKTTEDRFQTNSLRHQSELTMLPLREYQKRSLEALKSYLNLVVRDGAKRAFVIQTERPYRSPPQLPELPYICLRVPTGGGKTLMACHALGIAAKNFLQREKTVCLWLVPSNAIREQTLGALRNRDHPYRQVIDERFDGLVRVIDITESLFIQRSSLEGETVIILSTLAALRVEDTEGRKVYEDSGALQHHFDGLPRKLKELDEKREDGTIPHSLANVLRLWRPVVIMDEAHNARTPLSFHTLARFNPSCIIEFTATPETDHQPERELFASNVLHHVSAAELKTEEMIKLPIKLRTHEDWQEVIAEALQIQQNLEKAAEEEEKVSGEYIRPIVLFQAQPKNQSRSKLTVEVVKKSLIEDFKIPEEEIAVATGQTREIDNLDLFARSCPIRFIITVYALKEGWDCAFAYILCSLAEMGSPRAVEQILGRVLRLPGAKRKRHDALNWAYALAASPRFIEAANTLRDALIENGFQKMEAADFIRPFEQRRIPDRLPVFEQVSRAPNFSKLPPSFQKNITYEQNTGRLVLTGEFSFREKQALIKCFDQPEDKAAVERLYLSGQAALLEVGLTTEKSQPFQIPLLAVRIGGQLELFEESHFLDIPWNLAEEDPGLSEEEFPSQKLSGDSGQVDVDDQGKIAVHFVHKIQEQLSWLAGETGWTVAALANWIDRQIYHPDIPQVYSSLFIHKSIVALINERCLTIDHLAREKFRLRNAIAAKISDYRLAQHKKSYQRALFSPDALPIQVSPELILPFSEEMYSPNWYYDGSFIFQKHYFKHVGELRSEGEEFECAMFLDGLAPVKYWIRNLERRKDTSFWLQTSTDRFYPDFLVLLEDDRVLAIEYKGEHLWSNDDSKEKRAIGELWAERSKGKCAFVMTKGKNWEGLIWDLFK